MRRKKIDILGIPIDSFTQEEAIRYVEKGFERKKPQLLCTVNTEFAFLALHDKTVFDLLQNSTLNLADGTGILWAAKFLQIKLPKNRLAKIIAAVVKLFFSLAAIVVYPRYIKKPIPERISGSDFVWKLSEFAAKHRLSIFILGAGPTVAEQAALKLQTEIYDLKVAGTFSGTPKIENEKKIIKIIKNSKPDILLVAYGVPAEELWLERNLGQSSAKIGIGVGGTFDFLAGRKPRAPMWIQKLGLEWLFRLIIEPKRFKRQLVLPKFIWKVFKHRLNN